MEQQSLLAPVVAPPLSVLTDYGQVEGASRAHYVRITNGSEYLIKGPSFVPEHPTVAGNEWVAARVAEALGIPVLGYRVVEMGGNLFFASDFMQEKSFAPGVHETLFGRCVNREWMAYRVVVFDAWLINKDRHNENLIVRLPLQRGDDHVLILNDHSHLLVSPIEPRTAQGLASRLDATPDPYVSLPFVRESIVSMGRLSEALGAVEALPEAVIRQAVQSAPLPLLPSPFRETYERFLLERRARLRRVFQENTAVFANLQD